MRKLEGKEEDGWMDDDDEEVVVEEEEGAFKCVITQCAPEGLN